MIILRNGAIITIKISTQGIRPAALLILLQHGQFNSNLICAIPYTLCVIYYITTVYNIVPASMRIDKLIAAIIQLRCIFTLYIVCVNPISDLHALGHSSTISRIIERTGNHFGINDNIGAAGQILGHSATRVSIRVSGLISAKMEELTLVFEILHILIQQRVTKVTSSYICDIQLIQFFAAGISAEGSFQPVHMTRHIQHRDDSDFFRFGVLDDFSHFSFRQDALISIKRLVPCLDAILYIVAVQRDRCATGISKYKLHIIQQEAAAAIAK